MSLDLQVKFWVEQDGGLVLSDWRIGLLEAIAATGSLAEAAAQFDVSYRVAWRKLREIEQRLDVRLFKGHSGGKDGGGSTLTPLGYEVVQRYRHFRRGLVEMAEQRFQETFADLNMVVDCNEKKPE
mgnify:CR=1 FL=1